MFQELVNSSQKTTIKADVWRDGFLEQSQRTEMECLALERNTMQTTQKQTAVIGHVVLQRPRLLTF